MRSFRLASILWARGRYSSGVSGGRGVCAVSRAPRGGRVTRCPCRGWVAFAAEAQQDRLDDRGVIEHRRGAPSRLRRTARRPAPGRARRSGRSSGSSSGAWRRRDVVEDAAVFVVDDDQQRLCPTGAGGERVVDVEHECCPREHVGRAGGRRWRAERSISSAGVAGRRSWARSRRRSAASPPLRAGRRCHRNGRAEVHRRTPRRVHSADAWTDSRCRRPRQRRHVMDEVRPQTPRTPSRCRKNEGKS